MMKLSVVSLLVLLIVSTLMINISHSQQGAFNTAPTSFEDYIKMTQLLSQKVLYENISISYLNYQYFQAQGFDVQEFEKAAVVGVTSQIPVVGSSISTIIDMIWSTFLSNEDEANFKVYKMYRQMVIDIVDSQITILDTDIVIGKLSDINILMDTFIRHRADWVNNKKNKNRIDDAHDSFLALEQLIRSSLGSNPNGDFRHSSQGASELALFTQVATIHYLLLKDVLANGKAWKFSKSDMDNYKQLYYDLPKEYQSYLIDVYYIGRQKVILNSIAHGLSGSELYDNVITYKNYMTRFVFDIAAMWFVHDNGTPFPNGIYYDNVRYLWSKGNGKLINPIASASPGGQYYDYTDMTGLDLFFFYNERFKGDFASTAFRRDDNNYRGMQSCYHSKFDDYCESYVGFNSSDLDNTIYYLNSNMKTSYALLTYDILPVGVSFYQDDKVKFNIWQNKQRSYTATQDEYGNDWELLNYYLDQDRSLRTTNTSFPGHKIGAIVPHTINYEYVTYNGFNTERDGVIDGFYVGHLPTHIFDKIQLLPSIATLVNAQRSEAKEALFAADFIFPSVHAFKTLNENATFRFIVHPFSTNETVFGFGVRYHYVTSPRVEVPVPTISIEAKNPGKATITSKILLDDKDVESCVVKDYYKEFKIMKPKKFTDKNTVDTQSYNTIKLHVKGPDVYIHSIISYPIKKTKCTRQTCPDVETALLETSFAYSEAVPEDYVELEL